MRIKFETDIEHKKITLWFRQGDFKKIAERVVKENADGDAVSRNITYYVVEVIKMLGIKLNLPLIEFNPKFVMYKRESELPRYLQEEVI